MSKELEAFDMFVDDIISSESNLLKGELDYLIMQYIFESLELDNIKSLDIELYNKYKIVIESDSISYFPLQLIKALNYKS